MSEMCESRSCECEKAVSVAVWRWLWLSVWPWRCVYRHEGGRREPSVRVGSRVHPGCPLLRRGVQRARAGPQTRQGAPRNSRHGQRGFEPGDGQVGATRPRVGFGEEVRGGNDPTHRGRRRGCPTARGRRAAWRRRVAGKVPGSGGRPAPRRAGPPWCALGLGAPPPHIRAQETADPAPAVPCPVRPGCPAAAAAPRPLNPARPWPQSSPGSGPASAAGSERTPSRPPPTAGLFPSAEGHSARRRCRRTPSLPLPPARPEEAAAEGSAA